MPSLIALPAPAKLNLFLHVTGRREDGYHLLQSAFMLIDWQDTLDLHTRTDGALLRHDVSATLPADDLCLRAARLLQTESGTRLGCDIRLDKQVPWGAGMGGGSSDAATVLLALNHLWGLHWPRARLQALALRLGADVPFFVHGHNAWAEGVGEQLSALSLPAEMLDTPLALLKPPVAVPTPAIFASPLLSRDTARVTVAAFLAAPKRFGRNDLQAPAQAHSGQISQTLEIMQNQFGNSRMTGSGSTVFSWINDPQHPAALNPLSTAWVHELGLPDSNWAGRVVRGLAQHPLLDVLPC